AHWRGGKLKPLCVFELKRMPYKAKVTSTMSWSDIPICKEAGLSIDYLMLRGIFMPSGVKQEHVDYYLGLFTKIFATQEWKDLMERGAFNQTKLKGKEYADWVAREEARHLSLMKAAGFVAGR
ncbi:MAG: tripartite tricarboxylate transporter substrate binding protein, partial [Betaproteobacteria bacterium]|nr:tripartite tricarboxylate transporter substrate binding protein [Betaproteobacteria bacterium]